MAWPKGKPAHNKGQKTSPEVRERMRRGILRRFEDPARGEEWRKKQSESHKGQRSWLKGTHGLISVTEEVKRKISENLKGHIVSEETRRRLAEAARNRKDSYCVSKGEKELTSFIKSIYNGVILENYRKLFPHKGYEIDIYLPEKKLAFEFNGEYWHGPKFPKTVARDFWKQEHAKDLGVQIYFIWESDWNIKRKECEDFIKEVL